MYLVIRNFFLIILIFLLRLNKDQINIYEDIECKHPISLKNIKTDYKYEPIILIELYNFSSSI